MIKRIQKAALLVALISTGLLFIVGPFYILELYMGGEALLYPGRRESSQVLHQQ
jgi:hypothetical protein